MAAVRFSVLSILSNVKERPKMLLDGSIRVNVFDLFIGSFEKFFVGILAIR